MSALKKVMIALLVLILIAVIGVCVSVALLKRSPSDGNDSIDGNTDVSGDTDSGNTNTGNGNTNTGNGSTNTGNGNTNTGNGSTNTGSGSTNTGSGSDNKYNGLFAGTSTDYELTSDYKLTEADINATGGANDVSLRFVCSFNLNEHTLDLGGHTINIFSSAKDEIVFTNGKITNGKLKVSIPQGDIKFDNVEIDDTVTYELEAASETIRFSNAIIGGQCTIKSNTRVSVEYSTVSDITLTGGATLVAGNRAELGTVTVGKNAAGATVNIAPTASAQRVEVNAAATVNVNGEVSNIAVTSTASGTSVSLGSTANVATVAVNAGNTKIESDNATVTQVFVTDSIKNSVKTTGVQVTTANAGDMENYLGHLHVLLLVSEKEATCEADGETKYECAGCGAANTITYPKLGHKYGYTIQQEPTDTQEGIYLYSCIRCTHNYTAKISKEDAVYHHMDVSMISRSGKDFVTVRLQYVSDDSGEYYLLTKTQLKTLNAGFTETASTVKLTSTNGLPQIKPASEEDCKNWLKLTLDYEAAAQITKTEITGGILKLTENGYEVINGGRLTAENLGSQTVKFSGVCYCNVKNGETSHESAHVLSTTGTFKDGKSCNGGTNVTIKCKNCNYTETDSSSGHYYVYDKKIIPTQCNSFDDYCSKSECAVCHENGSLTYSFDYDNHSLETTTFTILTDAEYAERSSESGFSAENYTKLSDLAKMGLATEGYYYSYSCDFVHCAMCGLKMWRYYYYTYTKAEGCKYHVVYVYDYKGNVDFEAFEYTAEMKIEDHITRGSGKTETNLNDAIAEVKSYIGDAEIPFEPTAAYYDENKCIACDRLFYRYVYLEHGVNDDYCKLTLYYTEGKVSSWSFTYYYNFDTAIDRIKKLYGLNLDCLKDLKQQWVGCYYSIESDGDVYEYNELIGNDTENNQTYHEVWFKFDRGNDRLYINVYYVSKCEESESRYQLESGLWTKYYDEKIPRHGNIVANGENCIEDGTYCTVCNQIGVFPRIHDFGYENLWDHDWRASVLTADDISGLNAYIDYGHDCHDCMTYIGVSIVLNGDWTLTSDVYFKAEGIVIDLNGYTINLNGHTLAVYGYAGSSVVITDRKFDTSSPQSNAGKITGSGLLVVASQKDMYGGNANIDVGSVALDCKVFVSDEDNRDTLYNSVLTETGYAVNVLRSFRVPN